MDKEVIVTLVVVIAVIIMLVMGTLLIRAGIPDMKMHEGREYTHIRTRGYASRRRELRRRFFVSLGLLVGLLPASVWAVVALVDTLANAPYDFVKGQADLAWWPPLATLVFVSGMIVALVVWVGTMRRLKALESARLYAE